MNNIIRWIFAIIAVFLLVRLGIVLLNLIFNFSSTPLGRVISDGVFFDRISEINPGRIAIQVGVLVVIVLFMFRKDANNGEKPSNAKDT